MARTENATYPMKITNLVWLAAEGGHPFICPECSKPILPEHVIQFDHRHAVGRGGANTYKHLRPVHAAKRGTVDAAGNPLDCHDRKTFRPRGGATTIGSDNYEAKKTTRLIEAQIPDASPKRKWPSRPFPKARARPLCSHCGLEDGACICAHLGGPKRPWPSRKLTASRPFPPKGARPINRKRSA